MKAFFAVAILSLIIASSFANAEITDKSLVLYLPFDEGSGNVVKDLSLYHHDGALMNNPKWVKGKFGNALQFDGASSYVDVPRTDDLDIKGPFTIEAWINLDRLGADAKIVSNRQDSPAGGYQVASFTSNKIEVEPRAPGGGCINRDVAGGTVLKAGEWYYVAGTSDDKVANTYVNGKLDRTRACPAPHTATSRFDVNIGRAPDPVHGYFPGIVDEVRIWNRALSEKELQENMSRSKEQFAAVYLAGKLTTTWGSIKFSY